MRISEIGTLVEIRFFIRYCGIGFTKVVGSMGVGVVYLNGFDMRSYIVLSRVPASSFDSRFAIFWKDGHCDTVSGPVS
jgi:hypothetical protein